ncbi:MAG: glycerol-3-phosphate 1-O-acyltransferase PlsY [Candidatus Ratteibacteria bacterium]|nr:glycerol-3-phosphate 1-O-acyltransferase PlsY [Candidatus Ratteibacteria bacterium]
MNTLFFLALIIIVVGYLIGSFPTAYVIGKIFTRRDIRKLGSGNVGATNAFRVSGVLPGIITLIVDVGKGCIAVRGGYWIFINSLRIFNIGSLKEITFSLLLPLFAGLAAIIGHNWPVFLKFKGGKGVAATLGVCLAIYPTIVLSVILVWLLVLMLGKYVSLSSVISALTLPLFVWLYSAGRELSSTLQITYSSILALLILWRHKENIKRLIRHQERKFSFSKSG